jgi:hypothetical protein
MEGFRSISICVQFNCSAILDLLLVGYGRLKHSKARQGKTIGRNKFLMSDEVMICLLVDTSDFC